MRLFAVDPDGSDLVQLLDCETARPRFSPDGSRLAFAIFMDDGTLQVATMAADGTDLRILTSTAGYSEYPDWSPDGSWLIYSHSDQRCPDLTCAVSSGYRESLWRMDADGSNQRLLGATGTLDNEARLSPDGREAVFSRYAPDFNSATIMIRDLATGAERVATGSSHGEEHPDWSRDGKWIIYNTFDSTSRAYLFEQIERVPADDATATPRGALPQRLPRTSAGSRPTRRMVCSIAFDCNEALCRMDADGSNVAVLVSSPGEELNHVAWGVVPKAAK